MGKAESSQKIRQLAIVLSSIDRAPALQILNSLPRETATEIRSLMGKLGAVTNAERLQAFETLRPILKAFSGQASTARSISRDSNAVDRDDTADFNPASQILQSGFQQPDYAEIQSSSVAQGNYTAQHQQSAFNQTAASNGSEATGWIAWNEASSSVWAEVLQVERPILIATVLAHAPEAIASEILQQLPSRVAIHTLAAMPKIGHTEIEIYREIAGQLKERLNSFRQKSPAGGWGLNRALGIFESLPPLMRTQWVEQLRQMDESLALELVEKASGTVAKPIQETLPTDVNASHSTPVEVPVLKIAENTKSETPQTDTYQIDSSHDAPLEDSSDDFIAYDAEDFESLLQLSKYNLAQVIKACDPSDVLLALSGATRNWIANFERMLDRKELARFRERLKTYNDRSLEEVDAAQMRVVQAAVELGLFTVASNDMMAA